MKQDSNIFILSGKLFIISTISALLLSIVYSLTIPKISENEKRKEIENIKIVMPEALSFDYKGNYYITYKDFNKNEKAGYIFKTSAKGYGGNVICSIGIDINGAITGIVVVSHSETPGLGSKIEEVKSGESEPYYLKQFKGKRSENLSDIQTISGATISSKAVIKCVEEAYNLYNKIIHSDM